MAKPLTIVARTENIEPVKLRGKDCFRLQVEIILSFGAREKMARPLLKRQTKKSSTSIQPPAGV